MHAGKAVTDLREIFAKKEQEIRESGMGLGAGVRMGRL